MQQPRTTPEEVGENFPVASALLPESWRQPILAFYALVRGMDDISDSPQLKREEKRDQLRLIRLAFDEGQPEMLPKWAMSYYQYLESGIISHEHAHNLWQAFWQDTEKPRYRTFGEVIAYCRLSAVPVGRAVLEITKEPAPKIEKADNLCIALQLINHLQDVRSDYIERGRVYVPQQWLEEAGISERVLDKAETGPKLRRVFDLWLDEVDKLLESSVKLPLSISHRGLRAELRIIHAYARALSHKLRKSDPMTRKVKLSKLHKAMIGIGGILGFC